MAKRIRTTRKPGAKPGAKRAARPSAPPVGHVHEPARPAPEPPPQDTGDEMPLRSSSALTDAEVARAAELEAEAMATERAAIAESLRRRNRGQAIEHHVAADVNAPLSVRMAHEYAYVSRDVRRIALTAGLMVAILAILDILVNVLGVVTL